MKIQLNTDNHLNISESFGKKLEEQCSQQLDRFSDHVTRLEVYLSDQDGPKNGVNDKKCILEARLENSKPVAGRGIGNTYDQAVPKEIAKMKASLDTILGHLTHPRPSAFTVTRLSKELR